MKVIHTLFLAGALALPAGASFAGECQAMSEDAYINQPVQFAQTFERTAADCNYKVTVTGSVVPVAAQGKAKIPAVDPRVDVTAQATCPNVETAKLSSHILGVQPLTWRQLANSIGKRSHVITVERGHECTYGADFKLVNARLEMQKFDHYCKAI